MQWIGMALGAAGFLGSGNFLGGRASRAGLPPTAVALVSHTLGVICLGLIVLLAGGMGLPTPEYLAVSLVGGAASASATVLLYRALRLGLMAVNAPIVAATSIVTATVAGELRGDSLSVVGIAGIALAIVAVVGISQSPSTTGTHRLVGGLPEAIGAGVFFGIFSICLAASPMGAAETLFIARLISAGLLLLAVAGSRRRLDIRRTVVAGSAVGGFELGGNILMFAAFAVGPLAIVQTLISLNPVVTIILARTAYHEHLTRWQKFGSAAALASIALLALG